MHKSGNERSRAKAAGCVATIAALIGSMGSPIQAGPDPDKAVDKIKTATPNKHVIIIVGENRSFDHLYATYVPKHGHEKVLNLLSEGIVNADGTPGPNFAQGHQYRIVSAPNGGKYFISANRADKQLYSLLPPPDVAGAPVTPPYLGKTDVGLGPTSAPAQVLLSTGGTGLPFTSGADTRIVGALTLPPGPFQMTGGQMAYDAYTADTIHQYFQMYQQMDCAIDDEHVSKDNPTGCL